MVAAATREIIMVENCIVNWGGVIYDGRMDSNDAGVAKSE